MKLRQILCEEMRALFRGRFPGILLLLGIPIGYCIVFGLAYSIGVIKYVPTVIYDQDQTAVSRALVQAYIDSEKYDVVAQVTTQEDMEQALRNNTAMVSITIPPQFAQNIKSGVASDVLVETNSTNVMFANAVISSSQEIIQTFSAAIGQKLLEGTNKMPAPAIKTAAAIKMSTRILNNPTTSYNNFMLSSYGANGLQIAILLVAGPALAEEYSRLSRWQNTSSTAIVIGKLLPCWWCATGVLAAFLAVNTTFFAVPFRGDFFSVLLLGSAFTFLVINICFFFAVITKDEVKAIQIPLLYVMPGLLYSGLSWPDLAMSQFGRTFSAMVPLHYILVTLRDLLLAGYSPTLMKNTLAMYIAGGVLCLVSIFLFSLHRSKTEKIRGDQV